MPGRSALLNRRLSTLVAGDLGLTARRTRHATQLPWHEPAALERAAAR